MSVMPSDVKARINRALEDAGGNRRQAAEKLGWTLEALKNKIYSCVDLRARWTSTETSETAQPPSEIDCISPAAIGQVSLEEQQKRIAEMVEMEDERLRNGLLAIKLDSDEANLAMELQAFNRDHFVRSIDIAQAGVTRTTLKLQTQMDRIAKRLDYVRSQISLIAGMSEERMAWVEEEKMLLEQYHLFADELRKIMGQFYEAAKITALIRQKNNGKKMKKAAPGFQPPIEV